jgi:hypothetical protein
MPKKFPPEFKRDVVAVARRRATPWRLRISERRLCRDGVQELICPSN